MLISIQCFNEDRTITEVLVHIPTKKTLSKFNYSDMYELKVAINERLDDIISRRGRDLNVEKSANARRSME